MDLDKFAANLFPSWTWNKSSYFHRNLILGGSELLIIKNFFQLVVGPLLSILHVYSVVEEIQAVPVNTLNSQRTAMIVADFLKVYFELPYAKYMCLSFFIVHIYI